KEQSINRAGIVQEDIQPAGLKVWSDPFGRK
ncbi:PREDICTED: small integral membrane protein 20, partial [Phaethon lepturus]